MTQIHVQSPGFFTTVQDLGREDFGPIGVSPSGAADPVSLRLGNRLVGNPEGAAALEMTLAGGTFLFSEQTVVSIAGFGFPATVNGIPIKPWCSIEVEPGQALTIGHTSSGARCYLCVRGGIQVEPFLGSSSTHALSGLGGFEGRALRKSDILEVGPVKEPFRPRRLTDWAVEALVPRKVLRVTPGPQADWFSDSARQLFYSNNYRVAENSNRMGLRLEGTPIPVLSNGEMVTEGVSLGAIQVPESGLPIILLVDQQTTGGYPKIANVISADLPSVGQLRPRDEIRFEAIAFDAARRLLFAQEKLLSSDEIMAG